MSIIAVANDFGHKEKAGKPSTISKNLTLPAFKPLAGLKYRRSDE